MRKSILKNGFLIAVIALLLGACDAWKDDVQVADQARTSNLYEAVVANPDLATFAEILRLTGYDKSLKEEQALTVFAPINSVLTGVNLSDLEGLKEWIKNYISYLAYFTDEEGKFDAGTIRMINEKLVPVNAAGVSGAGIVKFNQVSSNGVLHVINNIIIDRKNIWEYLESQTGYAQIDFIRSINEKVMDRERSVQKGVDMLGRPLYDTVWVNRNDYLETYPLNDETKAFTLLLLEQSAWDYLQNKYANYMKQDDEEEQKKTIMRQIANDMTLLPVEITQDGRFLAVGPDSLLVNVALSAVKESYQASNGMVYKLNAVDVKMYKNKIKEKLIEAENYTDRWDGQDAWEVRYRPWASGGMDVVLKGTTRNVFSYHVWDSAGDSIRLISPTRTFQMHHRAAQERYISRSTNAYLKYEPTMYSVPYKISWRAFDDKTNHVYRVSDLHVDLINNDTIPLYTVEGTDTIPYEREFRMTLEQKLLISFPGRPELTRTATGTIENNFNTRHVLAGVSTAGTMEETTLIRYNVAADDKFFMLASNLTNKLSPYALEDAFGQGETLISPTFGKATFFVSNTVRERDANAGVIFLDYIRLEPLVDPNE